MTAAERTAALQRLEAAEKVAEAVCMVLRLAVEDLKTNPDPEQVANVVRFASNFAVRQSAAIAHHIVQIP